MEFILLAQAGLCNESIAQSKNLTGATVQYPNLSPEARTADAPHATHGGPSHPHPTPPASNLAKPWSSSNRQFGVLCQFRAINKHGPQCMSID